jgi:hypothetical protein
MEVKMFRYLLVLAMLLIAVSACKDDESSPDSGSPAASNQAASASNEAPAQAPVAVTYPKIMQDMILYYTGADTKVTAQVNGKTGKLDLLAGTKLKVINVTDSDKTLALWFNKKINYRIEFEPVIENKDPAITSTKLIFSRNVKKSELETLSEFSTGYEDTSKTEEIMDKYNNVLKDVQPVETNENNQKGPYYFIPI